jgi:pilus assembly protein CpaE
MPRQFGPTPDLPTVAHALRDAFVVVITFLGTKGGTGTTTMAVNSATAIHRLAKRPTVIVEVKPGPGDVAVFLGLRPRYSIVDLIDHTAWNDVARASRFVTEHESGVQVLSASEAFGRPDGADAEGVEQTLACCRRAYDFVVVDAGSTLTTSTVKALAQSDIVMLVANPDVPCLRNVRRLCDALRVADILPERVRILLNRASEQGVMLVAHIEKVLGRAIDFQVASDYRTVAAALNTGVPVSSLRPTVLNQQVDTMARVLIGSHLRALTHK